MNGDRDLIKVRFFNKILVGFLNEQIIVRALVWDFELEQDKLPVAELFLFPFFLESFSNGISK